MPHKGENVDNAIAIVDIAVKHDLAVCPVCSSRVGLEHLKTCQSFYKNQNSTWESQSKQVLESIAATKERIASGDKNIAAVELELQELNNQALISVDSCVACC